MALDGVLLHQIIKTIKKEIPLKINRITQASDDEFFFHCFNGSKHNVFISTHPQFARIQLSEHKADVNLDQTHMLMVLRKHFNGGIITSIEQKGFDRIVELHVEHRDEMGVIQHNRMVLELMGRAANLILLNGESKILDATRRGGGFESSQRSIHPGSIYSLPESFDKKPFTDIESYEKDSFLRNQFDGISPILEKEIHYRLDQGQSISEIKDLILESQTLYSYPKDYHILPLLHLNLAAKTSELNQGLDRFYADIQAQARIKDHTGDLLKQVRRELKRAEKKLPKLESDLDKALDSDHLRTYGDILFTYAHNLDKGATEFQGHDFEGQDITIPLDPRFSAKVNAQRYFKLYNKATTSLTYLEEQIQHTTHQIEYLNTLLLQLDQASVEDAQEIEMELVEAGLIRKSRRQKQQTRKRKDNYIHIKFNESTDIYVGKNNIQNDKITFKIANRDDMWFHVANMPGAHVLLKTQNMDEEQQRLCCQLAAYFSAGRHSSSVEVHYTPIRNIKKVPGGPKGLVSISTQKSMFIDPDEDYLLSYLKQ